MRLAERLQLDEDEDAGYRPSRRQKARAKTVRTGRRRVWRWVRRLLVALVALVLLACAGVLVLVETTPSVSNAESIVKARLAEHHAPSDNGVIPRKVAEALLATEDSRFYSDPALDPRGLIRGGWGALTGDSNAGGATIEVQLAKLLYTPGREGFKVSLEQIGLAIKLDAHYTKKEILAMYLNVAYFGDGAYGVVAAARHYFGLPARKLDWAQASLLAGLVQAPTDYDPHGHLTLALQRRAHVLQRLVSTGILTEARAKAIAAEPLHSAVPFYG